MYPLRAKAASSSAPLARCHSATASAADATGGPWWNRASIEVGDDLPGIGSAAGQRHTAVITEQTAHFGEPVRRQLVRADGRETMREIAGRSHTDSSFGVGARALAK